MKVSLDSFILREVVSTKMYGYDLYCYINVIKLSVREMSL